MVEGDERPAATGEKLVEGRFPGSLVQPRRLGQHAVEVEEAGANARRKPGAEARIGCGSNGNRWSIVTGPGVADIGIEPQGGRHGLRMRTSRAGRRLAPMAVSSPRTGGRRRGRPRAAVAACVAVPEGESPRPAKPRVRLELEPVASRWQRALDAAERALLAARGDVPTAELRLRRQALARERSQAAEALARLAQVARVSQPWLAPAEVRVELLGLPHGVQGCLFDLDGVLTDSDVLHALAWGEVLDGLLLRLADTTGRHFVPFDRNADYDDYIDGRTRLEGIHAFLASRGIRLPEGRPGDPSDAQTAFGLARRKGDVLARHLGSRGVAPLDGARRYLQAAGHAGLGRAVVSASVTTLSMLDLAGMAALVDARVDAEVIRAEGLRPRPAPDLLLVACRRLGVPPEAAVTFAHTPAGVAAGHTAGLLVVGVGDGEHAEVLRGFGADRVVPSLAALLDRRLLSSSP